MVISDKARFEKENHAGAIYILPMQDFKYDEIKGFGIYEWTSKKSVKPWVQISFSSALDAVQTMEV